MADKTPAKRTIQHVLAEQDFSCGYTGVMTQPESFFSMGAALRQMYLESAYDTPEEFLLSLECPDYPEPMQFPRY